LSKRRCKLTDKALILYLSQPRRSAYNPGGLLSRSHSVLSASAFGYQHANRYSRG